MTMVVFGHTGLLGKEVFEWLCDKYDALDKRVLGQSSADFDLTTVSVNDLADFFAGQGVESVFMCAGRVGGIQSNVENQERFLFDNARMAINVISAAECAGVKQLIYVSSSCAYTPGKNLHPDRDILRGPLEKTNEGYAIAKRIGMYAVEKAILRGNNYKTVIPCNLYGTGADDSRSGHVLNSLIRKVMEAKRSNGSVEVWGSGKPRREFLHASDAAKAIIAVHDAVVYDTNINIGANMDYSIRELVNIIADVADFRGPIYYNDEYPDGAHQKLMVTNLDQYGVVDWKPEYSLRDGIEILIEEWKHANPDTTA